MSTEENKQEEMNQIVTTAGEQFRLPTIAEEFEGNASNFISTIEDDGTIATKAKIYNAMSNNDGSLADVAENGEILDVVGFMVYPVTVIGDNGEEIPAKRTVLITQDGKSFGSVAEGIFSSLINVKNIIGMPPWSEPVQMAVKRVKTRRGFYTMNIVLVAGQ